MDWYKKKHYLRANTESVYITRGINVKKFLFIASIILMILLGCSNQSSLEENNEKSKIHNDEMQSSVEWADVIMWEDVHYYFDEAKTEEVSVQDIDKTLGKITFRVMYSEEENNPNYKLKNNESTYLREGATIYSLIGEDSKIYIYAESRVYKIKE
ncbi:hypothetical protein SAMN05216389_10665 [Oceanobacillus limi]|uniref:Uncharacterized protein n=1 Tax=Oceanobacillus limi TaxID=930131 RepID=A0A1I0C6M7_9BACI|nr:hypothetical protein [Oceanobacillus limi]SET15205.1 hypothetical protein SAMN05216389_10665 [Oceanobacillus limi]